MCTWSVGFTVKSAIRNISILQDSIWIQNVWKFLCINWVHGKKGARIIQRVHISFYLMQFEILLECCVPENAHRNFYFSICELNWLEWHWNFHKKIHEICAQGIRIYYSIISVIFTHPLLGMCTSLIERLGWLEPLEWKFLEILESNLGLLIINYYKYHTNLP